LKDFNDITFKDGESVDDFSLRIVGLANQVRTLGWDISDADIIAKMLQVVPDHLSQIAIAIETFLAVDTLSVEEVVGRLRQVEERRKKKLGMSPTPPTDQIYDKQGRLLLSEEEWLAKLKQEAREASARSRQWRRQRWRRGDSQPQQASEHPVLQVQQGGPLGPLLPQQAQEGSGPCGPR
jgi:hypothetical protein